MIRTIRTISKQEEGASAVEYGLLVAAIAAVIVIVVFVLGGYVQKAFDKTCDDIGTNDSDATTAANCPTT